MRKLFYQYINIPLDKKNVLKLKNVMLALFGKE